ncbi:MATE family efflux transporter [Polynucleobacter sphagniphilus]|uniref:Multidrug-efflux transporter n=1 Tax=Polynucleobacter sphagniphilus TaxID=1743169 RepID=A0AA43M6N5_9BURK|nr:MATE family efflux transporter [Polynucleobacter sphagniphilus]MDH6240674.1 MATE family multidrug resistance protein [Polynucleobacter sphagniphilus]MDH6248044.1 MATE family multidrug resistance protein [Polynucleobacter sphagniphilus]MDH6300030.1 MATE family multidrug resistance protein [Polynucleobacter sphagniphilus]MDH6301895.1 MATE family multidrug resistance protein [Polynucleobacter sphagniphilus]MDH6503128.1 MATE family multidrug resistance protein [Polynucleobacter sphagniphilus]
MLHFKLSRLREDIPALLKLAAPLLVGQLAVIAFGVLDTAMTARYSADDLAALAMASAIFISIYVGLTGVISALAPIAGQLFGAKRFDEIGEEVRQAGWLAIGLTLLGCLILTNAEQILKISHMTADIEGKARFYLNILAYGLPASMGMRILMALHNAVSRPAVITVVQLIGLGLKLPLNLLFIYGGFGIAAMGGPGCAVATIIVNWFWLIITLSFVLLDRFYQPFQIFSRFSMPDWHRIWTLLKLGTPIGFSYLIEVTSFTFMSLFIARLGTTALAGHQIIANMGTVIYMVPLSLSIATMTLVSQSIGANQQERAEEIGWSAVFFTTCLCVFIGCAVWFSKFALLDLYDPPAAVKVFSVPLFFFIAFYQVFDALQVTAAFILRAYRIAFWPMIIYAGSLWGVGLVGGYLLGFNVFGNTPQFLQGASGFWAANSISLGLAATLLLYLFRRTAARFEATHPPIQV